MMKLSKLHNSRRLLLKGVPVNKSLKFASYPLIVSVKMASSFFILWASSMMKISHGIFFKLSKHDTAVWNGVIRTSKFLGLTIVLSPCSLAYSVPQRISTCRLGIHFLIYLCQLLQTVKGQTIRCFPLIERSSRR